MKPIINKSEFPSLWEEGASDHAVIKDQLKFVRTLWWPQICVPEKLWGALCFRRRGSQKMVQKFEPLFDRKGMRRLLKQYDRHKWDQYFCPNVYTHPSRKLDYVFLAWLGWCDVDAADPFAFDPAPSVVWQTSCGNTQSLWSWDRPHTPQQASAYSKALTYRHGGDKGGSAANKLLRLPGSFNHKPEYDKPFIPLVHYDSRRIFKRPKLLTGKDGSYGGEPQALDMDPNAHDRLAVLKKYRAKLNISTRQLIRDRTASAPDKSNRIYAMVAGLHEANASVDEIASVVWGSPYFRDKYGDDRNALETEVSRIIAKLGDVK